MTNPDVEAITRVIERAYIQGIHRSQDPGMAREGFHPDFAMLVRRNNTVARVTVDQWLAMIASMKVEDPALWSAETTCRFELIDVVGDAAVAKLNVFKGTAHYSTDLMLLYRFGEGWRIVSKVFAVPPRPSAD